MVTHPRIFATPDPIEDALAFTETLRSSDRAVWIEPGPRHWEIFQRLCRDANGRGNLVPDAYLAALAIESGCEWVTTDRDYARFAGLCAGVTPRRSDRLQCRISSGMPWTALDALPAARREPRSRRAWPLRRPRSGRRSPQRGRAREAPPERVVRGAFALRAAAVPPLTRSARVSEMRRRPGSAGTGAGEPTRDVQ